MSENETKPVTTTQVVAILIVTLLLFFVVALVSKSVDAYRLKSWRKQLTAEIEDMKLKRAELEEEVRRRKSKEWVEEALRDAGQVPARGIRVMVATSTPGPVTKSTPVASDMTLAQGGNRLFANTHWASWWRLIMGFD